MLFTVNKMGKLGEQFNRFYRVAMFQSMAESCTRQIMVGVNLAPVQAYCLNDAPAVEYSNSLFIQLNN